MMQEVEVLKTIQELICSFFSEEQFTLSCPFLFMDIFFAKMYDGFKVIQGRKIMRHRRYFIDCLMR